MSHRRYFAGLEAQSALRINESEALRFNYVEPDGEVLHVALTTRWADEGHKAAVPRELLSEVSGPAPSLDAAILSFRAAADTIGNLVAFATNVAREPSRVVIAFDITQGETRHEFFQYFSPAYRNLPIQGRRPATEVV